MEQLHGADCLSIPTLFGRWTIVPMSRVEITMAIDGKNLVLCLQAPDGEDTFLDELEIDNRSTPSFFWSNYADASSQDLNQTRKLLSQLGFSLSHLELFITDPDGLHLKFGKRKVGKFGRALERRFLNLGTLLDEGGNERELVIFTIGSDNLPNVIDGVRVTGGLDDNGQACEVLSWRRKSIGRYWFLTAHRTENRPVTRETLALVKREMEALGFGHSLPDSLVPERLPRLRSRVLEDGG